MANNKTLILYHANCLDGFGAAYAAWRKFGDSADYLPVNYGNPPPDVSGKEVYILDFSYPREVLIQMHANAESLLVLDHHRTAQANLEGLDFAVFDMERSGCVMAWEYFFPCAPVPLMLLLIQDRDLWRFERLATKAFCEALRGLVAMDFEAWDDALHQCKSLTQQGEALLQVFDADIQALLPRQHPWNHDGITGLAVNALPKYASELGNKLAQASGTFGLVYSYDGASKQWHYSLRSIGDFDVSEIAKVFGGGGHKNAAGFSTKELLG